jgi:D-alanine-D-alanine ligase
MPRSLTVGVIFGGRSGEHEVSLVSATSVIAALDPRKYSVVPIGVTHDGRWLSSPDILHLLKTRRRPALAHARVLTPEPHRGGLVAVGGGAARTVRLDVVIPLIHGTYGEDGTLQGLLELADIPYVGSGVLGSAVGMDKVVQKEVFRSAGLPVVRSTWFHGSRCRREPAAVAAGTERLLRYPVFVKPANTGSSVGITKAHNRRELLAGLGEAASFDRKVIVEEGIEGVREIECSILGNDSPEASIPGEIIPSNEFYDYDAKYVDGKSRAVIPAPLPAALVRKVRALAVRAFLALDCAGMARVDFFVTKRGGRVYLNEINTIPGFTAISMYPKLWEASGVPYSRLLDRLIALARERHREKQSLRTSYDPRKAWYRR